MVEEIFYSFDWELFSWIATPLISLLAFVVYGAALYTSIKQNKIVTSTSLIPYFEEEIEDAIESGKNLEITITHTGTKIGGFNFGDLFVIEMMILKYNEPYEKDLKKGIFNSPKNLESIKNLSYGKNLLFLNLFFGYKSNPGYPSPLGKYFNKILRLIQIIEDSELTLSHQKILKFKIKNRLANEFLICYENLKWMKNSLLQEIPIPVRTKNGSYNYTLTQIVKTDFYRDLRLLNSKLTSV